MVKTFLEEHIDLVDSGNIEGLLTLANRELYYQDFQELRDILAAIEIDTQDIFNSILDLELEGAIRKFKQDKFALNKITIHIFRTRYIFSGACGTLSDAELALYIQQSPGLQDPDISVYLRNNTWIIERD